jgi:hypothetical protein
VEPHGAAGPSALGTEAGFCSVGGASAGQIARIPIGRLERIKRTVHVVQDVLAPYANCLTAQVSQSVGRARVHPVEARIERRCIGLTLTKNEGGYALIWSRPRRRAAIVRGVEHSGRFRALSIRRHDNSVGDFA